MSDAAAYLDVESLADALALALQEWHTGKRLDSGQALLRIDPRAEVAQAPFQFDNARAVLHCSRCEEIHASSRSALYAVWQIGRGDLRRACKKCRPMPNDNKPERPADLGDILLGLLSLVDQFGSILAQRGQDFRQTDRGRKVEQSLSGVLGELSRTQKEGVNLLSSAVDRLLATVNRYNQSGNGHQNGRNGSGRGRPRAKKKKKAGVRPKSAKTPR
jgi:hypothetical protein